VRRLARFALGLFGWHSVGAPPEASHAVVIAAPHTSNWDLALMLGFGVAFGLRVSWLGKHSLFRGVQGRVLRAVGGIPVDRTRPEDVVETVAAEFARRPRMLLAVAPEGTRGHREYWKSGFHRIARRAGVPIVPSFLDYATRTAGFAEAFVPGESLGEDMDRLRKVYEGKLGRYPEWTGPVRLREEGP